jgi:hypothetical protein
MLITPTTELEAVNECLENIGQAPVSTIAGDLGVDTQIALNFVRKTNRQLQAGTGTPRKSTSCRPMAMVTSSSPPTPSPYALQAVT